MAQCNRIPSAKGMQTRASKTLINNGRHLRKRRLSLRYSEDDNCPDFSDKFVKTEVGTVMNQMNQMNQIPLCMPSSTNKKLSATRIDASPSKKKKLHRAPIPMVDEPPPSDRDSVVSSDSYDSGVGSRSDEDGVGLPATPDKRIAKPITIEVVSPASRGVIELIDNGNDGYIGYFKPSPSSSIIQPADCTNCSLMKRSRVTRSISTNVSEDSNDSAFQGFRSNRRRDTNDAMKPLSFINDNLRLGKKSTKLMKKADAKVVKQKTRKYTRKDSKGLSKKSNVIVGRSSRKVSLRQRESAVSSKRSVKCSPSKRALSRIQHHNRSPQRSADPVTPTAISKRDCCTRSHAKSLLKDILTTPKSAAKNASTPRPKNSFRRHHFAESANQSGPNSRRARKSSLSSDRAHNSRHSPVADSCGTDSGVTSDDQQSTRTSACHWRFCKTEVCAADLSDHIERVHVASQRRNSKMYKCYWDGCKVYGKVAKSIIWLEGHVKRHLGARPYHCIFADCSARFHSQELLQRHVDTHIDDVQPVKVVKKVEPAVNKKNEKKTMKRMRGTEKCIPKRTDFFTNNVIEAVRWEHMILQESWSDWLSEDRSSLKLRGQIVAMATANGTERVQLHWFPEELRMADSWHDKSDPAVITRCKEVKLSVFERHFLVDMLKNSSH